MQRDPSPADLPPETAITRGRAELEETSQGEDEAATIAADPIWRLTAWILPLGAAASTLTTLGYTLAGAIGAATGYPAALCFALLCLALLRDARRRAATGEWARGDVAAFVPPLGLLLVALALIARGADIITYLPALAVLIPVVWEIAHVPPLTRLRRLFPYALPMAQDAAPDEADTAPDEVERIVREVVDRLPPDIAAKLEGWSVEVRDEQPSAPGEIVFGCCFSGAHVIAIYRRPHLRYYGRGERLRHAVTYTTLHEIGHALGLDEIGVRRLGWLEMPSDTH